MKQTGKWNNEFDDSLPKIVRDWWCNISFDNVQFKTKYLSALGYDIVNTLNGWLCMKWSDQISVGSEWSEVGSYGHGLSQCCPTHGPPTDFTRPASVENHVKDKTWLDNINTNQIL